MPVCPENKNAFSHSDYFRSKISPTLLRQLRFAQNFKSQLQSANKSPSLSSFEAKYDYSRQDINTCYVCAQGKH